MTILPRLTRLILLLLSLVAYPSAAQIFIGASLADDREVPPGASYEGTIPINNTSDEAVEVRLYLTDYRFDADGRNWYDEPGEQDRSNALWIGFGNPIVTIPAQSTLEVAYRVDVPDDPGLEGSYWSMMMVEAIPSESIESTLGETEDVSSPQFGVRRLIRYGVQIATHVMETGHADLSLSNPEIVKDEDGLARLSVSIDNAGSRLAESYVYLDLFDSSGQNVGRFAGSRARIYPGTSFRHSVPIDVKLEGRFEALFVIDIGDDNTFGAQYTLEL